MPTSRPRSPVRVPLGAPNESEQSNKQSTHALLAKTPLDYSSLLFGRRSLPVQVESPTIPDKKYIRIESRELLVTVIIGSSLSVSEVCHCSFVIENVR